MNTKTTLTIITMTAVMALAGCANSSGPHGEHNEKWYEQHTAARFAEDKWCGKRHFSVQTHGACGNAASANSEVQQVEMSAAIAAHQFYPDGSPRLLEYKANGSPRAHY